MKVNCLSCGHTVDLDEAYDDYEGLVKCFACRALLAIRTEGGSLKTVALNVGSPGGHIDEAHRHVAQSVGPSPVQETP